MADFWDFIPTGWYEEPEWEEYKRAGGKLDFNAWVAQGRPSTPTTTGLTWRAQQALGRIGYPIPPGVTVAPPSPAEMAKAGKEAAAVPLVEEEPPRVGLPGFETFAEASKELPNENWEVYRTEFGRYEIRRKEVARPVAPPPTFEPRGEVPSDAFGRTATWNARLGQWDYPPNFGQRPADQPAPVSPYQQQQFGLQEQQLAQQLAQQQQQFGLQEQQFTAQQQQFQQQLEFQQAQAQAAQEEQERRYRSQLAAQPINWLQYAAYTGEEPVVQPWMVPLGFQNVGGTIAPQGLQAGQPIPGFQGQVGQQGMQTFAGLPQLRTPSAQLQARWGPTATAQFLGYRQARTGATPEETQFRLGAGRAPTGAFGGFSRFR